MKRRDAGCVSEDREDLVGKKRQGALDRIRIAELAEHLHYTRNYSRQFMDIVASNPKNNHKRYVPLYPHFTDEEKKARRSLVASHGSQDKFVQGEAWQQG